MKSATLLLASLASPVFAGPVQPRGAKTDVVTALNDHCHHAQKAGGFEGECHPHITFCLEKLSIEQPSWEVFECFKEQIAAATKLSWKPAPWSDEALAKKYPNLSDEEKLNKQMQLKRECYGEAVVNETVCGTDIFCKGFNSIEECRQPKPPAAAATTATTSKPPAPATTSKPPAPATTSKPAPAPAPAAANTNTNTNTNTTKPQKGGKLPWKPAPWSDEYLAEVYPHRTDKVNLQGQLSTACYQANTLNETLCGTETFCQAFNSVEVFNKLPELKDHDFEYKSEEECLQHHHQPPKPSAETAQPSSQSPAQPPSQSPAQPSTTPPPCPPPKRRRAHRKTALATDGSRQDS